MITRDLEKFKEICSHISSRMPSSYQWQWDERFQVALIVFEKEDMGAIFSAVSNEFDQQWDAATISSASGPIGELVDSFLGILPGQMIFTCEQGAGLMLFAAWWPWGNGSTISLRIGIFSLEEHSFDKDKNKKYLTGWFNP